MSEDDRGPQPGESPKERHDRELIELLNELRVTLPGVQVLFAFLLAVPFATGWKGTSRFQRDVFLVAFLATAVSSMLLMTPSAYHRLRWRVEDKGRIVKTSNALAIAGIFFLAIALAAAVLLVTDYLLSRSAAWAVTAALAAVMVALWYGLPFRGWLLSRARRGRS